MPGRRLSQTERRLEQRWLHGEYPFPVLRRLRVGGSGGLRGLRDVDLEFMYPLTVLSGRNGTGKSTLLALSALAFHAFPGHRPLQALRRMKPREDSNYYTFADFFFRGPGDPPNTGLIIEWEYEERGQATSVRVTRNSDRRWMTYERRPSRPVHHIGIARTVPAIERRILRSHFAQASRTHSHSPLTPRTRQRLAEVMGRGYEDVQILEIASHRISRAQASISYTSFNMGAGEDLMIELLSTIQDSPDGSLIVIEEVELGLHPEAVRRLAEQLQELADDKALQMVVSTHSYEFLDSVPRMARVLVQRAGPAHQLTYKPSARYAIGDLSGSPQSELAIACEDEFAARLIEASLPGEARRRSRILPVGSKTALAQFGRMHRISEERELLLLVWDGDVSEAELRGYIRQLSDGAAVDPRVNWTRLPGSGTPEEWVLGRVQADLGMRTFADALSEDAGLLRAEVEAASSMDDLHGATRELSRRLNRNEEEVLSALLRAVIEIDRDELGELSRGVGDVLDGRTLRNPGLTVP